MWVDIVQKVVSHWQRRFSILERQYGLDTDNLEHIWLLQHLFLHSINSDLHQFADTWNDHVMSISGEKNRSPKDMFFFDRFELGFWGDPLPLDGEPRLLTYNDPDPLDEHLFPGYGVDLTGLSEADFPRSTDLCLPQNMNSVDVEEPPVPLATDEQIGSIDHFCLTSMDRSDDTIIQLWCTALSSYNSLFLHPLDE
jgi:hypothetical protein